MFILLYSQLIKTQHNTTQHNTTQHNTTQQTQMRSSSLAAMRISDESPLMKPFSRSHSVQIPSSSSVGKSTDIPPVKTLSPKSSPEKGKRISFIDKNIAVSSYEIQWSSVLYYRSFGRRKLHHTLGRPVQARQKISKTKTDLNALHKLSCLRLKWSLRKAKIV